LKTFSGADLTSNCRRFTLHFRMKLNFVFLLILTGALFCARAQTNLPAATNDAAANGYLQIQEQLHATQLELEDVRASAADDAKRNAETLAAQLQSLEQSVAAQRNAEAETARRTQQFTLLFAGIFGLAGLGILALMFYFQWRAFSKIAEISMQQQAALASASAVHQLAAPGRATVEISNARLLEVVGQLEQKISRLENGGNLLATEADQKSGDPLAEGQKLVDANEPQRALEFFDDFLKKQPGHAGALVKKAMTLEKLGRLPEALDCLEQGLQKKKTAN
jgi:tetratricopeptide (TPR) repeat protein